MEDRQDKKKQQKTFIKMPSQLSSHTHTYHRPLPVQSIKFLLSQFLNRVPGGEGVVTTIVDHLEPDVIIRSLLIRLLILLITENLLHSAVSSNLDSIKSVIWYYLGSDQVRGRQCSIKIFSVKNVRIMAGRDGAPGSWCLMIKVRLFLSRLTIKFSVLWSRPHLFPLIFWTCLSPECWKLKGLHTVWNVWREISVLI